MNRVFLLLLLCPFLAFSQSDHRISLQEKQDMPAYLQRIHNTVSSGITQPPSSPIRASAEWEEIDALMVAWISHTDILTEIVAAARTESRVIILCSDSVSVKNTLNTAGVPLSNIEFLITSFNSIWCRDYGQWNVYSNDVDSLFLIDWIYNRPRPLDDAVPVAIENYTGLPLYETTTSPYDLVHTGGNFMCDGLGTGFSSNLVLNENSSKTPAQIDTIMKEFMGIERYIKVPILLFDQIHHIDMHLKLLDEETLLVGQYPSNTADGPQIEANLQYILSNFNSVFGTPYKVVRIPMPPDNFGLYPDNGGDYRTYTNSVFVNKTVILPVYDEQYDTTAIRIYQEALPGYKIVGVDCNSIIPSLGAIHCITKEISSSDPLLIYHQPLHDTYNTSTPYQVDVVMKHRSGIQSANIYFRTDTTLPWQSIPMTLLSGDTWTCNIPAQSAPSIVYYYAEAGSISGKTQRRPMPTDGYWKFNVLLNTGVVEMEHQKPYMQNVFPNPSHGLTCIPISTLSNTHVEITLKNILGANIHSIYSGTSSGERKFFINTTDFSPGVYIVELNTGNEIFTQRILIR